MAPSSIRIRSASSCFSKSARSCIVITDSGIKIVQSVKKQPWNKGYRHFTYHSIVYSAWQPEIRNFIREKFPSDHASDTVFPLSQAAPALHRLPEFASPL